MFETWCKKTVFLTMLITLLAACDGTSTEPEPDASHEEPAAEAAAEPAAAPAEIETDEALLQVFVYGLGVFDHHRDREGRLSRLSVHLARAPMHETRIEKGTLIDGSLRLADVVSPVTNSTIWLDLPAETMHEETGGGPPGDQGFPEDPSAAASVHWMLDIDEVGGRASLNGSRAENVLALQAGTLETCGLVHDPSGAKVCRVQSVEKDGDQPRFGPRAMSEYMVIRQEIGADVDEIQLLISVGGNDGPKSPKTYRVERIELAADSEDVVEWNDTIYRNLFDIVVSNAPRDSRGRTMSSEHANELAKLFPRKEYENWSVESADCVDTDGSLDCEACRPDLQPECWGHLRKYFDGPERPGRRETGADASICPFVDYP